MRIRHPLGFQRREGAEQRIDGKDVDQIDRIGKFPRGDGTAVIPTRCRRCRLGRDPPSATGSGEGKPARWRHPSPAAGSATRRGFRHRPSPSLAGTRRPRFASALPGSSEDPIRNRRYSGRSGRASSTRANRAGRCGPSAAPMPTAAATGPAQQGPRSRQRVRRCARDLPAHRRQSRKEQISRPLGTDRPGRRVERVGEAPGLHHREVGQCRHGGSGAERLQEQQGQDRGQGINGPYACDASRQKGPVSRQKITASEHVSILPGHDIAAEHEEKVDHQAKMIDDNPNGIGADPEPAEMVNHHQKGSDGRANR